MFCLPSLPWQRSIVDFNSDGVEDVDDAGAGIDDYVRTMGGRPFAAEPVVPGNVCTHHAVDVTCFGSLMEQVYPAVCGV